MALCSRLCWNDTSNISDSCIRRMDTVSGYEGKLNMDRGTREEKILGICWRRRNGEGRLRCVNHMTMFTRPTKLQSGEMGREAALQMLRYPAVILAALLHCGGAGNAEEGR